MALSPKDIHELTYVLLRQRLVFAGKDASRGLAKSSVEPKDAVAEWIDLDEKEKGVLDHWVMPSLSISPDYEKIRLHSI